MKKVKQETKDTIYDYGVRLLAKQDYSEQSVRSKLHSRTSSKEWVDSAIERLMEYNYIDDNRFAKNLFKYCVDCKGYGKKRIQAEFSKRFLDKYLNDILSNTEVDWVALCMKHLDGDVDYFALDEKEQAKVMRKLASKGFGYEEIKMAFSKNRGD